MRASIRGLALVMALLGVTSCASAQSPEANPAMIDPLTIERTGQPNDALVCPPDRCTAEPDKPPPEFDLPANEVFEAWLTVVKSEPRTTLIADDPDQLLVNVEQRSRLFGFVDTISARVLPIGDARSSIAVYSRSNVGYWDLGVNKGRVDSWLEALRMQLDGTTSSQ